MSERRAVIGFEGLYEVDAEGNVYGLEKDVVRKDGRTHRVHARQMLKREDPNGYLRVNLSKGNRVLPCLLHRVIASAFLPNPDSDVYDCINHKDGNKKNNSLENLEWCTRTQNMHHAWKNLDMNLPPRKRGEDHTISKLTEEKVLRIRDRISRGDRIVDIARDFDVVPGTIDHIKRRHTWKHI